MSSENQSSGSGVPSFWKRTLVRVRKATVENTTKLVVSSTFAGVAALFVAVTGILSPDYPPITEVEWQGTIEKQGSEHGARDSFRWSTERLQPLVSESGSMELARPSQAPIVLKFDAGHFDATQIESVRFYGLIVGKQHKTPICRFEAQITIQNVLEIRVVDNNSQIVETLCFRNPVRGLEDNRGISSDAALASPDFGK